MVLNSTVKKDKKKWIANQFIVATWNVRGLAQDTELVKILQTHKINFASITESKKKLKESKYIFNYIMLFYGENQQIRGSKGVALFIHRQWENKIIDYEYLDERLILTRLKTDRGKATIIAAYAPEKETLLSLLPFMILFKKYWIDLITLTKY